MNESSPFYQVHLPVFEGPLDLLLHLIKINEIDIYDIPVALITAQYLEYLDLMRELNLDIVSDYLVMAATLAYIKSKMLLPSEPESSEETSEEDPRKELVQRLLNYERFKIAAEKLADQEILGRDVFPRAEEEEETQEKEAMEEASLFDLIEALRGIIKKLGTYEKILDFSREKISLKDKMVEILEQLQVVEYIIFQDLFSSVQNKYEIIVTFIAILELIRVRKIRVLQFQNFGTIRIYLREDN